MKFLVDMPASPDLVPWLEERNHLFSIASPKVGMLSLAHSSRS